MCTQSCTCDQQVQGGTLCTSTSGWCRNKLKARVSVSFVGGRGERRSGTVRQKAAAKAVCGWNDDECAATAYALGDTVKGFLFQEAAADGADLSHSYEGMQVLVARRNPMMQFCHTSVEEDPCDDAMDEVVRDMGWYWTTGPVLSILSILFSFTCMLCVRNNLWWFECATSILIVASLIAIVPATTRTAPEIAEAIKYTYANVTCGDKYNPDGGINCDGQRSAAAPAVGSTSGSHPLIFFLVSILFIQFVREIEDLIVE